MAEVDSGMDTVQSTQDSVLDSDVMYPGQRESDPMSQSMYDASTSDPMSQSMYGYDNGLPEGENGSTAIPAQFDSLCSTGEAQYPKDPGYQQAGGMENGRLDTSSGGGVDTAPVPEGMLIDFGGQNQNPFDAPVSQNPQPAGSASEAGLFQPSEQGSGRPDTVDDLINTELAGVSLNQSQDKKECMSPDVNSLGGGTSSACDTMEGGGMTGGDSAPMESHSVNGDVEKDSSGFTEITKTTTVTESSSTVVNGEVTQNTQVTKTEETTKSQTRSESRIPQKPTSPKKSGLPLRSPKKETVFTDVGPGWDDSITIPPLPRPKTAHLLSRQSLEALEKATPPPRPASARQSIEKKKYGIDSKRADYKPGGGDVRIFNEKKEYKAEARISHRASPSSRASPKPATPRTPPVTTPSPNLTGVRSKIGSLDKAAHTPGGGNVRIVTKKSDFSSVSSRVGSKDKLQHKPGGGNVKIENKKVVLDGVGSRIGSLDNAKHKASGGDKKIETKKLNWKVESKVGSLDNTKHVAGGGDKKIETKKIEWKVESKVGSMDNARHVAGGGDKKIESHKVDWKVGSKVGSLENAQHSPGGGDKKIFDEKVEVMARPKVGSMDNVKHSPGGGDKVIETQKLNFKETAKARTKHGVNDDGSRRSNSVTSQSTTESQ